MKYFIFICFFIVFKLLCISCEDEEYAVEVLDEEDDQNVQDDPFEHVVDPHFNKGYISINDDDIGSNKQDTKVLDEEEDQNVQDGPFEHVVDPHFNKGYIPINDNDIGSNKQDTKLEETIDVPKDDIGPDYIDPLGEKSQNFDPAQWNPDEIDKEFEVPVLSDKEEKENTLDTELNTPPESPDLDFKLTATKDGERQPNLQYQKEIEKGEFYWPAHYKHPPKYSEFSRRYNNENSRRKDRSIIPLKASPELVLKVVSESARLEALKRNHYDEEIQPDALRNGDFWNSVWKEDVNPLDLRTLNEKPAHVKQMRDLDAVKFKITPGTQGQKLLAQLTKISPRLLYIVKSRN